MTRGGSKRVARGARLLAVGAMMAILATLTWAGAAQAGVEKTQVYQMPLGSEGVGLEKLHCHGGTEGLIYILFGNAYERYVELAWARDRTATSGFQTSWGGIFNIWTLSLLATSNYHYGRSGAKGAGAARQSSSDTNKIYTQVSNPGQGTWFSASFEVNTAATYADQKQGQVGEGQNVTNYLEKNVIQCANGTVIYVDKYYDPALYGGNSDEYIMFMEGLASSPSPYQTQADPPSGLMIYQGPMGKGFQLKDDGAAFTVGFFAGPSGEFTLLSNAWQAGAFTQISGLDFSGPVANDSFGEMALTLDAKYAWAQPDVVPASGAQVFCAYRAENGEVVYRAWNLDGQAQVTPSGGSPQVLAASGSNTPVVFYNDHNQSVSVLYSKSDGELVLATKPAGQDNFNLQHIDSLSQPTEISASAGPDGKVHAAAINREGGMDTLFYYSVDAD